MRRLAGAGPARAASGGNGGRAATRARSWPGAAAGLLGLAALLAVPLQAQAQSTDPVWSTTMTVGDGTDGHRGFNSDGGYGSLDDDEFTVGLVDYDVIRVLDDEGGVRFLLSDDLPNKDDYILELAGAILPLSAASVFKGHGSQWLSVWTAANASSLSDANYETTLPLGGEVTVCLRTAAQVCPKATDPVWSTTMTVGQATGDIRGYDPRNSPGTLDVDEFTVSGVVYDVRVLVVGPVKGAEFWISPALTGNPVLPNKDDYILEVAGVQLPLTGITNSGTDFFKWHPDWLVPNASSLDPDNFEATLPLDGEVTVCLRTATQVCPGGTARSTDATLSDLVVNDGTTDLTLAPAFASDTFAYTTDVASSVSEVTLTATRTHTGASVSAVTLGGNTIDDTDFTDGITVSSLIVGANVIVVTVTAEDGITTKTYTVTATTSTDPVWATTMTVGDASGDGRGFQAAGYGDYDEAGSLGVSEFTVPGDQTYRVLVLAVDTDWHFNAAIDLSENLANSDNYILELAGEELPLRFSNGIDTNYFTWDRVWLALNASSLDPDNFENTLPLDGRVQVCLRTATQVCPSGGTPLSTDASLSDLVLTDNDGDAVDLDPAFAPATRLYTARVAHGVDQITIIPTKNDTNATYEIQGKGAIMLTDADDVEADFQVALDVGDKEIRVAVTAEDGIATLSYRVDVSRALAAPKVTPTPGSTTSLDVSWTAPPDTTVVGYDVQYREGNSGDFSDGPQAVTGTSTSTSITSLMMNTSYQVRVRMTSDKGDSEWSSNSRAWTHPPEVPVPSDWEDLVPGGLAAGAKFRLLYVSHGIKWNRSQIDRYSEWVQAFAAGNDSGRGHADIRAYASAFRAVGCGSGVNARVNTGTQWSSSDRGVPIFWLGGAIAADDYGDFYDGSWQNEDAPRTEAGALKSFNGQVLTGCEHNGNAAAGQELGTNSTRVGILNDSVAGPLSSVTAGSGSFPIYGLSQVFVMRTLSTDATLSALTVNDGTTDHTIDLSTAPYTQDVGNAVTTVTLTAEPTHSGASVSAVTLGGIAIADTDFTDGITVPSLLEGANVIVVTVTAEDGSTESHTVTVTREATTSANAVWSTTMTVGEPSSGVRGYRGEGSVDVDEFTVSGEVYIVSYVMVRSYKVELNIRPAVAGDPYLPNADDYILEWAGEQLPLADATYTSSGRVRWDAAWLAANASSLDADTYETTMPIGGRVPVCLRTALQVCPKGTTPLSTDATLSALTVNDGTSDLTLAPAFVSDTLAYTTDVASSVSEVTLTATPTYTGAEVSAVTLGGSAIADADFTDGITVPSLLVGENVIVVTVTAEDTTTTQTYTVTVTREASTTVCTAPDLSGRMQIWTGTVTVGAIEVSGVTVAHGFGVSDGAGALDDTTFSVGLNNYTIDAAFQHVGNGSLRFSLTSDLTTTDRTQLTLHVCDDSFAFSAASTSTLSTYDWSDSGLDWSDATTVSLVLSTVSVPVTIEAEHESIGAGLEDLNFTLTRTGDTTEPLDAPVTITQQQSWLGDSDLSHTVPFLAGEPTATLTIAASKFSFTPSTTGDLTATVSGGSDTVQIVSTSAPPITVGFDKSEYTFEEDETDPAAVYMVATLDAAYPRAPSRVFGNDAQFAVSTQSDTARFRDDFASVNTLVDLRADDFQLVDGLYVARKPISDFAILDDAIYEGSEQFLLKLNNGPNLNANVFRIQKPDGTAGGSYDVIITDEEDLPVLSLSVDPPSIAEEDDDATTGVTENVSTVTVAIANDKTFVGEETVTLTFSGDATEGTHYSVSPMDADTNAAGHQVLLPADDGDDLNDSDSSVAVTVTAAGNDTADGNVTLTVTGDFDGTDIGSRDITIVDDDTTTSNTAATGAPGIMGTPREGHDLTATIGTIMDDTDGLPTFPDDYTFQWVRLDSSNTPMNIGTNSSTYPVLPADVDSTIRVDVNFTDLAGNPEGPFMSAAVGPVVALLPELSFAETTVNVDETAGPVELTVNLAPASAGTVTVDYATSNGPSGVDGAEAGEDYTAQSDTLTFIPGETSKTITIQITDDDIHEEDVEFFVVDLANPSGATESATAGKTEVHITSEDSVPVASMDDVSVDEGAGTMRLTLGLSHPSSKQIRYTMSSGDVGGTATVSEDYADFLSGFSFRAFILQSGELTKDFDITIIDDGAAESDETITIKWTRDSPGQVTPNVLNFTGTITDAAAVPGAPTSLTATASGTTTIDLSWTAPGDNGGSTITGYKIEVSPNGTSSWSNRVADTGNTDTAYSHTGLDAGTTRHYRVSAINSVGSGAASNVDDATTATAATVPGAPTGLTATASGTSTINLTWNAPSNDGGASISGYRIEVSSNGGTNWNDRVADTGSTNTTYAHTGLSAGATRHYRVSAINSAGTGAASGTANATTGAATVPGAPTGLRATASGSNRINLSWTEPADNGGSAISGYRIEVSSNGGTSWTDRVADTGSTSTTYAHTGLSPGATRHYRVSAINSAGTGGASNVANATTFATDESGLALACNMSMETVTVHEGETAHFTIVIDPPLPRDDTLLWYVHDYGDATTPEDLPSTSGKFHLKAGATQVVGSVETLTDNETEPTEGFQIVMDWDSWRKRPDWRSAPSCTGRIYVRDGESNGAPVFDDGERTKRKVAENTAPGKPVGKPVTAEDPNGDPVTYSLEGQFAALFAIDAGTGQLRTAAALDHESKAAYEVKVKADDDRGGTATIAVTVNVDDEREPPSAPGAPTVERSGRSLSVSWSAPENTGPPMKYDLRYAEMGRGWRTDAPRNLTKRSAKLDGLEADTEYEVQVLAHNDEGASRWSKSTFKHTGANAPPAFAEDPGATRNVAENTASGRPIGDAVSADDPEGDELTYTLEGLDAGSFRIDSGTGQLRTRAALDHESKASHTLTVKADDGEGGTATIEVTVNVTDVDEEPLPAVSIGHARVEEGQDAVLEFAVTLDRASSKTVTVEWETRDGTATAGNDYVEGSDTLIFKPSETSHTIRVEVLDDSHDEGNEVMRVVLSNPVEATIAQAKGRGTGTIKNSDPMPAAWLTRFGRAASDHVVEAISGRWGDGERQTPQTHFTLGGRKVDKLFGGWDGIGGLFESSGPGQGNPALEDESTWARMDRLKAEALGPAGGLAGGGFAGGSLAGGNPVGSSLTGGGSTGRSPAGSSLTGGGIAGGGTAGRSPEDSRTRGGRGAGRSLMNSLGLPTGDLRDVLMGSSFFYSRPLDEDGRAERPGWLGQWSTWGETAATRFSGADGKLSLNGEVATAILGADSRWDRWLAGVTLSQSEGEGVYTHPTAAGGAVSSTLTSLNPYVHYRLNERTSLWGVAGYGVGGLKLTPDGVETGIETDLATTMAAFGGRGVLSVRTGGAGRFELALRSDALLTHTDSEAVQGLVGAQGATSRVRLVLEGSGSLPVRGGVLRPTLEAGLRYDGGDAETGAGLEVGGGLGYAAGNLSLEVKARALVAHEDTEYEEWGFSGSVAYTPGKDGRGLSMKLGSAWGSTQSGVQSLWSRQDASGLARGAAMNAAQRFQAELGYGFAGRRNADALWVPFLGAESGEGAAQSLRMGVRLTSGPNVEMGLELGRREGRAGAAPEQTLQLRGALRW
ncbi:fibronectin type III domain-containing protein [Candidatus Rariloculus sp.]|uniref:fibronectin type III domain-containing protein n=1 Tax=Candidatus Rariloculus sp. TaxID=3101265 RepID=UPI003D0CCC48